VPEGIDRGAREGERAAGPVGAIVGGTIGGVVGVLGVDARPHFDHNVVEEHRPSYRYEGDERVGAVLPEAGVTYYDVPPDMGFAIIDIRSSTIDRCWLILARDA
jgi:hypothetical protein